MCPQNVSEAAVTGGLDQPILAALKTRQAEFAVQSGYAIAYGDRIAPFAAIGGAARSGLPDLAELVRSRENGVTLLQADDIPVPDGVRCEMRAEGVQMVLTRPCVDAGDIGITRLTGKDVPDMLALVALTEPGPFLEQTIRLGDYFGVRRNGRLIAMAGERMQLSGFCEVSAVCVHPAHRGQRLARHLVNHVAKGILGRGDVPFLHTYARNEAAIGLYRNMGFDLRRSMWITHLTARDGWCVLTQRDAQEVERHFEALSDCAYRQRFGSARSPHVVSNYITHFLEQDGIALGYYRKNRLVAIGEIRPSAHGGPDVCEVGATVSAEAQGQGLGLKLAFEMRRRAKEYGFRAAEVLVDYSNAPVLAILRHFDRRSTRRGGVIHFQVEL